jgi:hypothetical protein
MGKRLEISDMPPLTVEVHSELRLLERKLQNALGECCSLHDLIDPHAAFEYTRTYATEFYDCFYAFYSGIPDSKYRARWRPASETFAFDRVVQCIKNELLVARYFASDASRVERIKRTISDHAKGIEKPEANHPALTGKQAAAFARAGIDMASASPLMLMAHAAAQESARREGPTSRLTAPKRRIPRSIHSESATKKLEDYLNAKGLSQTQFAIRINVDPKTLYRFRTTGNVGKSVAQAIAQAMGITLEEFTSR